MRTLFVPSLLCVVSACSQPLLDQYVLDGDDLFPEGITFDTSRQAFVVGSLEHGRLTSIDADGTQRVLFEDDVEGDWAISGVKYDSAGDNVWACANTMSGEAQAGSEIWQVHVPTADLVRHDLSDAGTQTPRCNDLVLGPDAAYVTDSQSPYIYRIPSGGTAEVFATHEDFHGTFVGMNGLDITADGVLLAARFRPAALFRVPLNDGADIHQVDLSGAEFEGKSPFSGADGLIFLGATLYVTMDARMLLLDSDDGWSTATVRHIEMQPGLSTATVADDAVYAVKSEVVKHVLRTPPELPFAIVRVPQP
ncbi:MAG: sugar lactone lactonase YvrE [Kiritimatiellia bacterium]|jgi:sugar lactone lactonase YvrE